MKLTILGCGSSVGVPSVSCKCDVCVSTDARNRRLRTSALIEIGDVKILIDAGPDLREQALKNKIEKLTGVIFTHQHADHINGIDDLKAFKATSQATNSIIPIYADKVTLSQIESRSSYMFIEKVSGVVLNNKSYLKSNLITHYQAFNISGVNIMPFPQEHGEITSLGLVFNKKIAYCTDVKRIPEYAFSLLEGLEVLVIECLGYTEVKAHAHFDLSLDLIRRIQPKHAIFTHMGHELEFSILRKKVAECKEKRSITANIIIPYDGYQITTNN